MEPDHQDRARDTDDAGPRRAQPDRYRIRSVDGSACVGLRGGAVAEGAEAIHEPCADSRSQEFTVELIPAGR